MVRVPDDYREPLVVGVVLLAAVVGSTLLSLPLFEAGLLVVLGLVVAAVAPKLKYGPQFSNCGTSRIGRLAGLSVTAGRWRGRTRGTSVHSVRRHPVWVSWSFGASSSRVDQYPT